LTGLNKALKVIDKIISTIKKSKDRDEAQKNLIKSFHLTQIQANAILEMRLQTLAALERKKVEDELKEKQKLIEDLKIILKNPKKVTAVVVEELLGLKKNFVSPRKTQVMSSGLKEFREEDLIPKEDVVVILTQDGYIKRMPPNTFRSQRRGGKGLIGFDLREEDAVHQIVAATTHDNILFFSDRGRAYQTKVYEIPVANRTSKGKSIFNFLEIPPNDKIVAFVTYTQDKKYLEGRFLMTATRRGIVKKTPLGDFGSVRRTGIIALKLKKDDGLKWAKLVGEKDQIIISTALGQAIRFKGKDVRPMGRGASGVSGIRLRSNDSVAGIDIIREDDKLQNPRLLTIMARGFAKQTPLKDYKTQRRGGSGIKTAKITDKTGSVIGTRIIGDGVEEVLAFSSKGQALRTKIANIRIAGRATQGVRIMNLEANDRLVDIICF
jgi:DNA gyrase subunit A